MARRQVDEEMVTKPARSRASATGTKRRSSFARRVPRAVKRKAGATVVSDTPLMIHVSGMRLGTIEKTALRAKLGRRLKRFAPHIERVTVRLEDVNGPRGGKDTVCRIELAMSGMKNVFADARAHDPMTAFEAASRSVKSAVETATGKRGRSTRRRARTEVVRAKERAMMPRPVRRKPPARRPAGGSLIGRRVGRSRENLERAAARPEKTRRDAWTDTAQPGVSATDRKAGGGSTAARNTRLRAPRATATLEDSARKPSRKSTRKSANRAKSGSKQARRQKRKIQSPSARARRASP